MKSIYDSRADKIDYTNDQYNALYKLEKFKESTSQFFLLIGNAGSGKTTIAENIANYFNADVLAPTNTAVNRLREKFGSNSKASFKTIYSQLYGVPDKDGNFQVNKTHGFKYNTTYIIDECSMIDEFMLMDIFKKAEDSKNKIIFIGDDFQLEPVGKDPKMFTPEFIQKYFNDNYHKLNEVKRNDNTILKISNHLRLRDTPYILDINDKHFERVKNFSDDLGDQIENNSNYVILVSTNKIRIQWNNFIRKHRFKEDSITPVLDQERVISVSNQIYANGECFNLYRPVVKKMFKETIETNDGVKIVKKTYDFYYIEYEDEKGYKRRSLLIANLDLPSIHPATLMKNKRFAEDPTFSKFSYKYKKFIWNKSVSIITYAYAISVHKSQGNEWDYVYINADWLSDNWNKSRWFYTAITRAKKKVELKQSNQYQIQI